MNSNSTYLETTYSGMVDCLRSVVREHNLYTNEKLLNNSFLITNALTSFFSDKQFTTKIRKELLSNKNNIPTYTFNLDISFEGNSNKKIKLMFKLNDKNELHLYNGAVDFSITSMFVNKQKISKKSYSFTFLYSSEYTPHVIMCDEKMSDYTSIYFSDSENDKKENLKTLSNEKKNIFIENIQDMYTLNNFYTINPNVVLDYFFLNKKIEESFKEVYDLTYDCNSKNADFDQYFIDLSEQKKIKMVTK